ncbi:MAG: ATP-binding protein [Sneathiella sp.]
MPLDTQTNTNKNKQSRTMRLSRVLAAGFFLQMVFVVTFLLLLSYFIADFLVTEERKRIAFQGSEISNLVGEARLKNLNHILFVATQNEGILTSFARNQIGQMDDLLNKLFNAQSGGDLDFLLATNERGQIILNIGSELQNLSSFLSHVKTNILNSREWFLGEGLDHESNKVQVFTYLKKELVDPRTGKLRGFLIGGIFLNNNLDLATDIRNRTGAIQAELRWKSKVISSSNTHAIETDISDTPATLQSFKSNFLIYNFPNQPLQTTLFYSEEESLSLKSVYFFASVITLAVIAILTLLTIIFVKKAFQSPFNDLVNYAMQVKKRTTGAIAPNSNIVEFKELSNTLDSVFNAFQESEMRFQDFADIASDGMWEANTEGQITYLSRSSEKTNKFAQKENYNSALWEIPGVDLDFSNWENYKENYKNQSAFRNFVFRRAQPDGKLLYWTLSARPIYSKIGNYIGFRGTATNITTEIEAKAQATAADDKFRQAQKMDAVGQLTSGIAHDFNNILNIILGNFELLETLNSDNKVAMDRIDAGLKSTLRGADLTRKLLDFSRKDVTGIKRISVNSFISDMGDLLKKSLTASINLNFHLDGNIWLVDVDPGDLQDVIINLALNARDAMPDGGHLMIETCNKVLDEDYTRRNPQGSAGEFVMLSVSDTGHGMTAETLEHASEPFFTTKEQGKGTGLGLSMVYGFVTRSHGHFKIYSEVGKGTTLNIYLPRTENRELVQETKTPKIVKQAAGTETILVVDDEEDLRDVATMYLESFGYKTLTAGNSAAALKTLKENPSIGMLFSDVVMPGDTDGYQLALIAHDLYPQLKILLTSGFTKKRAELNNDGNEYLIRLNDRLLSKPYNKSELMSAIQTVLLES